MTLVTRIGTVTIVSAAPPIDAVFRALADPTRRDLLSQLTRSSASTSQLATAYTMTLPSLLQHLRQLEACGLVESTKRGRTRIWTLVPTTLQIAEHWLAHQRRLWTRRLDQLDAYAIELEAKENAE